MEESTEIFKGKHLDTAVHIMGDELWFVFPGCVLRVPIPYTPAMILDLSGMLIAVSQWAEKNQDMIKIMAEELAGKK